MNLNDSMRWYIAEAGVKMRGISVMFDVINACSFRCPSCPVGNSKVRSGSMMSLAKFQQYLDIIQRQVKIRYVLLYSFSEPTLHPQIHLFVRELKKRGLWTMISTNLSKPERIEPCFKEGLDELRISFSGFEQGEYFHAGRSMKQFISACNELRKFVGDYKTNVGLIFHEYKTNLHELPAVARFAEENGFYLIREKAFFIPYEKIVEESYSEEDKKLIEHLQTTPQESIQYPIVDNICYYQQKQLCIDANGDVFLCRHVYDDRFIVGNIGKHPVKGIRENMANHSFCLECKKRGLNNYTP